MLSCALFSTLYNPILALSPADNRPSVSLAERIRGIALPPLLYHYTTQAGCLGILSSRRLWATGIRFFNDEKEFVLAHDIAFEYLTELKETCSTDEYEFFHTLREGFAIGAEEVFVSSFSTDGDLLSQWRGYAASGYSLGFAATRLAQLGHGQLLLAPCVYAEDRQADLIHQYVDAVADYYRWLIGAGVPEGEAIGRAVEDLQAVLGLLAPLLKHSSFREEGEWRLIASPIGANSGRLQFRPGRSMLIPYVEIPLSAHGEALELEEVVVGPTPHPSTSVLAIQMLQLSTGNYIGQVRVSDIPYRDW